MEIAYLITHMFHVCLTLSYNKNRLDGALG
jgi:hypothetical protein